jgi:hypothetical protein
VGGGRVCQGAHVDGAGEAGIRVDLAIQVKRYRSQTVEASKPRQEKFAAPGSLVQTTKVEPERRVPEFPMIFWPRRKFRRGRRVHES